MQAFEIEEPGLHHPRGSGARPGSMRDPRTLYGIRADQMLCGVCALLVTQTLFQGFVVYLGNRALSAVSDKTLPSSYV